MGTKFKRPHPFLGYAIALLIAGCVPTAVVPNPAPDCYRPHWPVPFKIESLRRIAQRPFETHLGDRRYITVYSPGPFKASLFFVMSPDPSDDSIGASPHIGILLDSNRNGTADCVILAGGTLPDAKGKPVPYNYFAIDRDGNGAVEAFIGEDLDLDGDRIMDRASVAVLSDPDPEGHFLRGVYYSGRANRPIKKEGGFFLLEKPLFKQGFRFADDEVTKMNLFPTLQSIWKTLEGNS